MNTLMMQFQDYKQWHASSNLKHGTWIKDLNNIYQYLTKLTIYEMSPLHNCILFNYYLIISISIFSVIKDANLCHHYNVECRVVIYQLEDGLLDYWIDLFWTCSLAQFTLINLVTVDYFVWLLCGFLPGLFQCGCTMYIWGSILKLYSLLKHSKGFLLKSGKIHAWSTL